MPDLRSIYPGFELSTRNECYIFFLLFLLVLYLTNFLGEGGRIKCTCALFGLLQTEVHVTPYQILTKRNEENEGFPVFFKLCFPSSHILIKLFFFFFE